MADWRQVAARRGRGRPARAGSSTVLVALRLTPEERSRYQLAADAAGLDLSSWLRAAAASLSAKGTPLGGASLSLAFNTPAGDRRTHETALKFPRRESTTGPTGHPCTRPK